MIKNNNNLKEDSVLAALISPSRSFTSETEKALLPSVLWFDGGMARDVIPVHLGRKTCQSFVLLQSFRLYIYVSSTPLLYQVLDSIYFSRRFHVRCVAQARDKAGHLGTPLRSNIATIGTEGSICHTPVTTGTARGFQAQSFIATLKYLDVKHKEHPNR